MRMTQRSHSAITPSRDIVTPVPHCIAIRPVDARTSATSCSSSAGSTSAAAAARSIVNARERAPQRTHLVGITVLAELVLVGAVGEERVGQRAEHRDVGTGPDGNVRVGECRGLGAPRVEHPHATTRGAVVADASHGIGERGAVAVRDDRVGADEDREPGNGRIPDRVQHRIPADQLGRDEHRRVVDRDRGEEGTAPDRRQPLARRDLARRVVRETGRQVERDRVGSAVRR